MHIILVSHTMPRSFPLDDLPGAGGRADVVCRVVAAALFVSHGIRDAQVTVVTPHGCLRFDGARLKGLRPDERSIGGFLLAGLAAMPEDPFWEEVRPGLDAAALGLADVVPEGATMLHKDGEPVAQATGAFVLSDHVPFTDEEDALLRSRCQVRSLGPRWLHADHCVHVLAYIGEKGHA